MTFRTHFRVKHIIDQAGIQITRATYAINGAPASCALAGGHYTPHEVREIIDALNRRAR